MAEHVLPICYGDMDGEQPSDAYQTIFAHVPCSTEMPSETRPFTQKTVDRLRDQGVEIASTVLHTGVSSLEVATEEMEDQTM